MNYITTTQLRSKTSHLINSLKKGDRFSLVHRSKVVGVIEPVKDEPKKFDVEGFKRLVKELNLPHLSYAERERRYRAHLMKKYGKGLPRR